jgi:AraC-like DNA-binding protein
MVEIGAVIAKPGGGARPLPGDELAQLIIEASRYIETDLYRARCCIRRAADIVQHKLEEGLAPTDGPARRGALARWQAKRVAAYIESNISDCIRARDLATVANLSAGHFFRAFRVSFGVSPHVYLMRRRILRAELQMATTTDTLARIAVECGLADQSHLCKAFRRVVGVSPSSWRRAVAVAHDNTEAVPPLSAGRRYPSASGES